FREYQRCCDQRRHDHAKSDPEHGRVTYARFVPRQFLERGSFVERCGRHRGVATNRPVGRNNNVRIRMTKDTSTACDGSTQIAAEASTRLMKIAAAIEPPKLPIPPTTTTMNALSTQSSPIVWLTPTIGANSTPLAAAIAAPIANTPV